MRTQWCRFEKEGKIFHGIIENSQVYALQGAPWEGHTRKLNPYPLSEVKLLIPVVPTTFYCVGLNYREHILASAKRKGIEPKFPQKPDVNYRSNSALCAHEDCIVKPKDAGELFQYEGELVVVIGKKGKKISLEKAPEYIFGWTIGNDVSERTWQRTDRTGWRAKNSDTFNPMGPWIVSGIDYKQLTTTVRLNGEEVDRFSTGQMIHDVETYIAEISQYCTLYPGDVIWMGTDGSPRNLKSGDTCEIEISEIGTLRNRVIEEA
ncbi:MAG: fumarylacetoacetate hydrolase family protein [Betaproteobacteria bacterium]